MKKKIKLWRCLILSITKYDDDEYLRNMERKLVETHTTSRREVTMISKIVTSVAVIMVTKIWHLCIIFYIPSVISMDWLSVTWKLSQNVNSDVMFWIWLVLNVIWQQWEMHFGNKVFRFWLYFGNCVVKIKYLIERLATTNLNGAK